MPPIPDETTWKAVWSLVGSLCLLGAALLKKHRDRIEDRRVHRVDRVRRDYYEHKEALSLAQEHHESNADLARDASTLRKAGAADDGPLREMAASYKDGKAPNYLAEVRAKFADAERRQRALEDGNGNGGS